MIGFLTRGVIVSVQIVVFVLASFVAVTRKILNCEDLHSDNIFTVRLI